MARRFSASVTAIIKEDKYMEQYIAPEITIVAFDAEDVITTSTPDVTLPAIDL